MLRQYRIFYKRGADNREFSALEPFTQASIYDRPEVNSAVEIIGQNPVIEGIALRLGDEMFNVIAFSQEALAPRAFEFPASPVEAAPIQVSGSTT